MKCDGIAGPTENDSQIHDWRGNNSNPKGVTEIKILIENQCAFNLLQKLLSKVQSLHHSRTCLKSCG